MSMQRRKLGQILRMWKLCSDDQIRQAIRHAKQQGMRIGEALVELKLCSENNVIKALASQANLPFIDLEKQNDAVQRESLSLLPEDFIRRYKAIPLEKEGNRIKILCSDPMNLAMIDDLRYRMKLEADLVLGAPGEIKHMLEKFFNETQEEIRKLSSEEDGLQERKDEESKSEEDDSAPIVKLVNQIIVDAVNARASDIHIEPMNNRVRLRYRIDGVCHERDNIPKRTQASITARMKIMAGVRVEEKRIPQDGRIKARIAGETIDFRVSFCPAYHGESIVLRILRPAAAKLGLNKLGMREDTMATFKEIISRPNGIFLVTGPTGSGKTTTLYTALQELNRPDRKIITAEDPVEYNFKGINQCQVNETTGLTFPRILRSMLRQAPNIILVGEIRDKPVGEVAIQAALTGHMVFSTLHTNDAPGAMTRMIDMGLKPFLVASSVQAVLAQRLVRVLCDECKLPDDKPDPHLLSLCDIKPEELANRQIYREVGCPKCSGTGFAGRRGVYELLIMSPELRELTFNRAPVNQLRKCAVAGGMRPLLGDGKFKILEGSSTPAEISKIAQVEGVV